MPKFELDDRVSLKETLGSQDKGQVVKRKRNHRGDWIYTVLLDDDSACITIESNLEPEGQQTLG